MHWLVCWAIIYVYPYVAKVLNPKGATVNKLILKTIRAGHPVVAVLTLVSFALFALAAYNLIRDQKGVLRKYSQRTLRLQSWL